MANFQAKTKEELSGTPIPQSVESVDELPSVDVEAFGYAGDVGSALHRAFRYATRRDTLDDVMRVGYFGANRRTNDIRDFGVKEWDVVTVTIGNDPATAIEVDLRIVDVGTSRAESVVVALGLVREFSVPPKKKMAA